MSLSSNKILNPTETRRCVRNSGNAFGVKYPDRPSFKDETLAVLLLLFIHLNTIGPLDTFWKDVPKIVVLIASKSESLKTIGHRTLCFSSR
ncbi:BnaC08g10980D [Brassica napus]|uniref:BnaC08g10980D protein n=1 Tax=Brassica napus TaxID=3708 RepID=A0A078FAK3_BRANA|nr:BnaC08g10980D [Brassica napus]